MARGPERGISTTINGLSVKVGALDDGDLQPLVLAIGKSPNSCDYYWHLQEDVAVIDYNRERGDHPPVRNFMEAFMEKVNTKLQELYGAIDPDSKEDLDILNRMIEKELTFDNQQVVYKDKD